MLDTRMPPISTRPRRPSSSARPAPRPQVRPNARLEARPAPGHREQVRDQAAAEPIRRALPSARTSRLARSEMRLMGLATACTAVVCALLLLYLAAYAQVTQLGIDQAQARTQLRQNQLRNALLQSERNSLECPQRIDAAAAAQGMTPRGATPVDYVPVDYAAARKETKPGSEIAAGWEQGRGGDTTEDSGAAAFRDH